MAETDGKVPETTEPKTDSGLPQHPRAAILKAHASIRLRELMNKQFHGWAKPEDFVDFVDMLIEAAVAKVQQSMPFEVDPRGR